VEYCPPENPGIRIGFIKSDRLIGRGECLLKPAEPSLDNAPEIPCLRIVLPTGESPFNREGGVIIFSSLDKQPGMPIPALMIIGMLFKPAGAVPECLIITAEMVES
jgi:hypothetical protein